MIFYLVLRALDTVEDDMTIDPKVKIPLLRTFDEKLNSTTWTFTGSGPDEKDRLVLIEFDKILVEYHKLKPQYQDIIKDITYKMGNGMADYILDENFNTNGLATIKDYDLYCHYVAGLVGEGLTKLMVLAKFSDSSLISDNFKKSESMGLFLQKTNIIRDYSEDLDDGRSFWPKEIWEKYTNKLSNFRIDNQSGLNCISELVLNALDHVKHVLEFLALVKDPSCFNFCAIPQVMAIATLATIYNNPDVLHKNVKIRKGTTCNLILNSRTLPSVVKIFRKYIQLINHKSNVEDANYLKIGIKCGEIEQFCESLYPTEKSNKQKQKINEIIDDRLEIDNNVQKIVNEETKRVNTFFASLIFLFFGVSAVIYGKS